MTRKIIDDLIYPELSYKIVGCAFEVYNELGFGHAEKIYQKALAISFTKHKLNFKEQVHYPIKFQGELVGKGYCDFLVEEKIIVELKKEDRFSKANIEQVNQYLKSSNLKLGLLINFSKSGAICKRIVNIK